LAVPGNSPQKKATHRQERRASGIRNLASASLHLSLKEVADTLELMKRQLPFYATILFLRREEYEN
jgi:hypothetical protein